MHGAMVDEDLGCDPHPADGSHTDCGSSLAVPYFVSYILIGSFVFLNLVVAIILETFGASSAERDEQEKRKADKRFELVNFEHIEHFKVRRNPPPCTGP